MTNSADPDQLANWSGSTLFAKTGHVVFSMRRVKCQLKCRLEGNKQADAHLIATNA